MPRLLDLCCCAGGAAMGYHRAGFHVYGVDKFAQPNYPFAFHQGTVLVVLRLLMAGEAIAFTHPNGRVEWLRLVDFDAIHGSPPCQQFTKAGRSQRQAGKVYPDLLTPMRQLLLEQSLPWVLENVPDAPMRADIRLCGCQFGLGVYHGDQWLGLRRERWFETSWHHFQMMPTHDHTGDYVTVVGHGTPSWSREKLGFNPTMAEKRAAMGMDWTSRGELSEAIPPAYTEWIGGHLLAQIEEARVA